MLRIATIAGITALLMSTAYAGNRLPEAMLGDWCYIEGESNETSSVSFRITPEKECHGGDNLMTIAEDGWEGEYSCKFEKIEQVKPNMVLIQTYCDDETRGPVTIELINNKLIITSLSEG